MVLLANIELFLYRIFLRKINVTTVFVFITIITHTFTICLDFFNIYNCLTYIASFTKTFLHFLCSNNYKRLYLKYIFNLLKLSNMFYKCTHTQTSTHTYKVLQIFTTAPTFANPFIRLLARSACSALLAL